MASEDVARYPFVLIDVTPDAVDDLSALLFELGAQGVEERDGATLARGASPGLVTLVASFAARPEADEAAAALGDELRPRVEEIVGDGWRDAWKEHFHPFALTERLTVKPPWEAYTPTRPGEQVLELEPGRAFGTGLHSTTSLVSRALDRASSRLAGAAVLDVGTGSGVLALVALRLGAARAVGLDNDPEVIAVATENAARNGLSLRFEASTRAVEDEAALYPVVLANIEARVLVPMAPALVARVAPGGLLLLSGVLAEQEAEVRAAYPSLALERVDCDGEWVCLQLSAPP